MQYFYYRIYKALVKVKTNTTPALNSMLLVVILQGLNIFSILMIVKYFFNWEFTKLQSNIQGLLFYIIMLIPNYFYLYRKRDEIISRYQNESKEDKKWGIIGLLFYIVFSILVFFVLGETIVEKHY
jgi:hypothetical protein